MSAPAPIRPLPPAWVPDSPWTPPRAQPQRRAKKLAKPAWLILIAEMKKAHGRRLSPQETKFIAGMCSGFWRGDPTSDFDLHALDGILASLMPDAGGAGR